MFHTKCQKSRSCPFGEDDVLRTSGRGHLLPGVKIETILVEDLKEKVHAKYICTKSLGLLFRRKYMSMKNC